MKLGKWTLWAGALGVAILFVAQARAQNDEPAAKDGVEVLARGPVHEAFAEPTQARPGPSEVVTKKPPDPIEELPAEQKPEGDHVVWIPGYWGWDDEQKDYLWVSGFWRVPPPDRQWAPGNWQEVDGGWHWTAGFWAPSAQQEVTYLPAPPPSIDEGASTPAPDEGSTYVPGSWVYRERRYLWRPGFWLEFRPGWVWIPAHYVWTPAGYVFVDGYWDLGLDQRGLLFAPVRIRRNLLAANWVYIPQYCVQPDFLLSALFVRPACCHYYFGDYFEDVYARSGFLPWFDYRITRGAFDPNFTYFRHRFPDRDWDRNLRAFYAGRFSGEIARPPRTLVQQNTVITKSINITNLQSVSALAPVTKINNTKVTGLASLGRVDTSKKVETAHIIKMEAVPKEQQADARKAITQYHEAAQQRHQAEAKILAGGGPPVKATDPPKAVKIELPKAPTFPAPQGTKAPPAPQPPPPPKQPQHEEKPIPKHEPPKAAAPPKQASPPPPAKEPAKEPPKPAPKEPPPPPPKEPPKPPPKEPPKDPPKPPPKEPPPPPKEPPKPPPKEPPKDPPKPPPKEPPPPPKEPPKPPPKEPPKPPPKEPPPKDKEPPKDKPPLGWKLMSQRLGPPASGWPFFLRGLACVLFATRPEVENSGAVPSGGSEAGPIPRG